MGKPVLVLSYDLVVAMDYGQFVLRGGESSYEADLDATLLEQAQDGPGIAAYEHTHGITYGARSLGCGPRHSDLRAKI